MSANLTVYQIKSLFGAMDMDIRSGHCIGMACVI